MTKVKATKPSPELLAIRRAKEPMPKALRDFAGRDRRAFINSVSPFIKGEGEEIRVVKFKLKNIFTNQVAPTERISI